MALLEQYGSDAVRYWAASARPGTDTAFDENQMKVGRKLAIKLLNASKFVLATAGESGSTAGLAGGLAAGPALAPTPGSAASEPVDRALLAALAELVEEATVAFEGYDYARALERTETFFWAFCDDYLELVKGRAYGSQGADPAASAQATLRLTLSVLQRLFAPFVPYVSEEVWSWWQPASVHRAAWPAASEIGGGAASASGDVSLDVAAVVLGAVRRTKSEAKRSMRAPVASAMVTTSPERASALQEVAADVKEAGVIAELSIVPANGASEDEIAVELATE
jgi:valyl-tRNA synthetase